MSELRQRMIREMELRDFAENTQKAYLAAVEGLVRFYMKPPDRLNREQVEDYPLYLKKEKKSPYSTRNQITSGLKFFYNCTLKRDDVRLELPKKTGERKLPEILAPEEVLRVVEAPANLKHRVLLKTTYSAGLRVGEVIALKPEHIDSARMLVRVESSKGRKDRDTILSKRLLPELRYYYKVCRPRNWLFPGKDPEKHICATTAQRAYTKAKKKAKIKKGKRHPYSSPLLRHPSSGAGIRHPQDPDAPGAQVDSIHHDLPSCFEKAPDIGQEPARSSRERKRRSRRKGKER